MTDPSGLPFPPIEISISVPDPHTINKVTTPTTLPPAASCMAFFNKARPPLYVAYEPFQENAGVFSWAPAVKLHLGCIIPELS